MDNKIETRKIKLFRSNPILNIFFIICFSLIALYYLLSAPIANPSISNRQGVMIHVAPKESLSSVAKDLESKKIVRQAIVLKLFVTLFKFGRPIMKGDYLFNKRLSVVQVAWMLAKGEHGVNPIRITIKEGLTNTEIASIFADKLVDFRKDLFLSDPRAKQGYLFPDTYFFFPLTTSSEILDEMTLDFNRRIAPLKNDIDSSGHSLDDIIKMASIIQNEAHGASDAGIISGILWKRIADGMMLQVDTSKETYHMSGLPEEPISNPGLISIEAAIHPVDSPYLYYLHDKNGIIHLATTFAQHKSNIAKYLK